MPVRKPDLLINVDSGSSIPLYQQVFEEIRKLILNGALVEGEKLPPIRKLTKSLGVSHATIERAYLQLSVEGYVQNMPRSGYTVNRIDISYFDQHDDLNIRDEVQRVLAGLPKNPLQEEIAAGAAARYNFSYCNLQPGSFPRKTWIQLTNEVVKKSTDEELSSYWCHEGPSRLHVQLAHYLQQARGVVCEPEQIVFQSGTEAMLNSIVHLFIGRIGCIGHEEPGYEVMTAIGQRFPGATLAPLPVTCGAAGFLDALDEHKPRLVFTTPSHQFPTGKVMPLETRIRLLQWAQANDAYIIEDDSCNEYRYNTQAIPSLQSLDRHNRVIYICNFSKALSPGLRIAYAVLPPELLGRWHRLFTMSWDPMPYITRETLASFIEQGHWAQHLRKMAADNKRRHDLLVECLQKEFGDKVELSGLDSGMHLYVTVKNGMTQQELIESARRRGAAVHGTDQYWFSQDAPQNTVLVGFSAISYEDIPSGVEVLRRAWFK